MHWRQASDERLYLRCKYGGRGLKSIKVVYEATKVRVACYMASQDSEWTKVAWEWQKKKEGKSPSKGATETLCV